MLKRHFKHWQYKNKYKILLDLHDEEKEAGIKDSLRLLWKVFTLAFYVSIIWEKYERGKVQPVTLAVTHSHCVQEGCEDC